MMETQGAQPDIMDENEAAVYLRVSARTLEYWRQNGKGPPYSRLGTTRRCCIRYVRERLLHWVQNGEVSNGSHEAG